MATYTSDGKKLIDVEYDVIIEVNDMLDGMRVLSVIKRSDEEYAVFLLEANTKVTCYINIVTSACCAVGKKEAAPTQSDTSGINSSVS